MTEMIMHLASMLTGTIEPITAAALVNLSALPPLVVWLALTALIRPLIFWWNLRALRPARTV